MKLKNHLLTALGSGLVAVGSLALWGCSKESLPLDDIDTTLGWELKEFSLPGNNSTHEIRLQELFDIDTTGVIKIDPNTGDYVFRKKGDDIDPTTTEVDPINVSTNAQDIHPDPFRLSASDLGITIPSLARRAPGAGTLRHTIQVFNFNETGLSGDVVSLTEATTNRSKLTLTVHFSEDLSTVIDRIENLSFQLPRFLRLSDIRVVQNGTLGSTEDNIIEFSSIGTGRDFVFQAAIASLDFAVLTDESADEYLIYRRTAANDGEYEGEVQMKGKVDIVASLDQSRVTTDITKLRPDMEFVISSDLSIEPITITGATGQFSPKIDFEVGDITIDDVPDLLDDPEVSIRLHDMAITFDVESDLGLTGIIDGTITSRFDNGRNSSVDFSGIEVKPMQTSHVVLSRLQPAAGKYPSNWQQIYNGHGISGDMQTLIDAIPETIEFHCQATTKSGETGSILLGHTYTFIPRYEIEAPLALDEGSRVVYRDTIDGWADDLEDVSLRSGATVKVEATVRNTSPMALKVDITPVDASQRSIANGIDVVVTTDQADNNVAANGVSKLTIVVTQKNDDAFNQLDGLHFKATALGKGEGQILNSGTKANASQTLRLENITATVSGQVRVKTDD